MHPMNPAGTHVTSSLLGAFAAAALFVTATSAQNAPPPRVLQITTVETTPATMMALRNGLRKEAAAAKAAKIPSGDVGWRSFDEGNRTLIVRPHPRDELFLNTQLRQKIAKVDSAAAEEVGKAFDGVEVTGVTTEILQESPNLTYMPAQTIPDSAFGGTITTTFGILPGQGRAFNEAVQAINKVLAQIKYPYVRRTFRVRMGTLRVQAVTFIDSRENYYGKNSIGRLLQAHPEAREALVAAYQALLKTVSSIRTSQLRYSAAQSYPPGM